MNISYLLFPEATDNQTKILFNQPVNAAHGKVAKVVCQMDAVNVLELSARGNGANGIDTTAFRLFASDGDTMFEVYSNGSTQLIARLAAVYYPVSTTANQILYSSANNTIAGLASGNNGLLVTDGSGAPSIGTDIPTAVTIGSKYIYRAGGTDVVFADGGLGFGTGLQGDIIYLTNYDAVGKLQWGGTGKFLATDADSGISWHDIATDFAGYIEWSDTTNVIVTVSDTSVLSTRISGKADSGSVAYLAQDETITGNWVNTANPWTDDEVADNITVSGYQPIHASLTSISGLTESAGDILYATADNTYAILDANATATKKFLSQSLEEAPTWATISGTDLPSEATLDADTTATKKFLSQSLEEAPTWATISGTDLPSEATLDADTTTWLASKTIAQEYTTGGTLNGYFTTVTAKKAETLPESALHEGMIAVKSDCTFIYLNSTWMYIPVVTRKSP